MANYLIIHDGTIVKVMQSDYPPTRAQIDTDFDTVVIDPSGTYVAGDVYDYEEFISRVGALAPPAATGPIIDPSVSVEVAKERARGMIRGSAVAAQRRSVDGDVLGLLLDTKRAAEAEIVLSGQPYDGSAIPLLHALSTVTGTDIGTIAQEAKAVAAQSYQMIADTEAARMHLLARIDAALTTADVITLMGEFDRSLITAD